MQVVLFLFVSLVQSFLPLACDLHAAVLCYSCLQATWKMIQTQVMQWKGERWRQGERWVRERPQQLMLWLSQKSTRSLWQKRWKQSHANRLLDSSKLRICSPPGCKLSKHWLLVRQYCILLGLKLKLLFILLNCCLRICRQKHTYIAAVILKVQLSLCECISTKLEISVPAFLNEADNDSCTSSDYFLQV